MQNFPTRISGGFFLLQTQTSLLFREFDDRRTLIFVVYKIFRTTIWLAKGDVRDDLAVDVENEGWLHMDSEPGRSEELALVDLQELAYKLCCKSEQAPLK